MKATIKIASAKTILFTFFLLIPLGILARQDMTPGYKAGPPTEMQKLSFLEGDWTIDYYYAEKPVEANPKWVFVEDKINSSIESLYDGAFYIEKSEGYPLGTKGHEGFARWSYWTVFSYDRHNHMYRVSFLDNIMGLNDTYEGHFENGEMLMSNEHTRTFSRRGTDRAIKKNRFIIKNIDEDTFELYWQSKDYGSLIKDKDGNISWIWAMKIVYKRIV